MATPSITMIPSGYKSQKVYSVLPTNGDGDLTFDRNNAGSRVNKDGLIEQVATDVPRLDYSDGSCPSLLSEPASLNLATYSEDFSQWTKSEINGTSTIISSSQLSPSGTNNAYRVNCVLDDNTLNNQATFRLSSVSGLTSSNRTVSFYLRSDTSSEVMVRSPYNDGTYTTFQLTNNWERYSVPLNDVVVTTCLVEIGLRVITGFGDTNLNATFDVWGAQLEEGANPSSYIPTSGSTATRSADIAQMTGDNFSSWYNQSEGTLFAQWVSPDTKQFSSPAIIKSSAVKNSPRIYVYAYQGNKLIGMVKTPSESATILTTSYVPNTKLKTAIAYNTSSQSSTFNGNTPQSANISAAIPTMIKMDLGDVYSTNDRYSNHHISRLSYYNERLTDAELQTITL